MDKLEYKLQRSKMRQERNLALLNAGKDFAVAFVAQPITAGFTVLAASLLVADALGVDLNKVKNAFIGTSSSSDDGLFDLSLKVVTTNPVNTGINGSATLGANIGRLFRRIFG